LTHQQISDALQVWVEHHPAPDEPVLSVANFGQLSPRELSAAIEQGTPAGRFVESMILFGAAQDRSGLDGVLESFLQESGSSWHGQNKTFRTA
jgi:hypothetical protein